MGDGAAALHLLVFPAHHELHHRVHRLPREIRKGRHAPRALADHRGDLGRLAPARQVRERRDLRRRSGPIVAMADGALREIHLPSGHSAPAFRQARRPGHLGRIDVEQAALGIEGRAAPLRAAIETREDDGLLADAQRNELPAR